MNNDTVGDPPVPIELLLLGFFRYVGHSFTMDNLEEATAAVSAETHRQFKLFFLEYVSTHLWNIHVVKALTNEDALYNSQILKWLDSQVALVL